MSSNANVSLPLSDYQAMQREIEALKRQVIQEQAEKEAIRLGADDSDERRLLEVVLDLMEIAGHAIANLDPLAVRDFPHAALSRVAAVLPDLPGIPPGMRESATDLKMTAENHASWAHTRSLGLEQERLAEENSARAMGQTHAALAERAKTGAVGS